METHTDLVVVSRIAPSEEDDNNNNDNDGLVLLQGLEQAVQQSEEVTWRSFQKALPDPQRVRFAFGQKSTSENAHNRSVNGNNNSGLGVPRGLLLPDHPTMRQLLTESMGMEEMDLLHLSAPEHWNKERVLQSFHTVAQQTNTREDSVFVYYSGTDDSSSPTNTKQPPQDPTDSPILMRFPPGEEEKGGSSSSSSYLTQDEFVEHFLDRLPEGVQVVTLWDCVLPKNALVLPHLLSKKSKRHKKRRPKKAYLEEQRAQRSQLLASVNIADKRHFGCLGARVDVIGTSASGTAEPSQTHRLGLGRILLDSLPPPTSHLKPDMELLLMKLRSKLRKLRHDGIMAIWTSSQAQDLDETFSLRTMKRALLVGIGSERYDPTQDVYDLRKYWDTANPDLPDHHCRVVMMGDDTNAEPTRHNILEYIRQLLVDSQAGESVLFFLSGQGGTHKGLPYIKPVDWEESGVIMGDDMFDHISAAIPDSVTITCIIDSIPTTLLMDLPHKSYGDDEQAKMYLPAQVYCLSGGVDLIEAFRACSGKARTWAGLLDRMYEHQQGEERPPVLMASREITAETPFRIVQGGEARDRHALLIGVQPESCDDVERFWRYLQVSHGFVGGTSDSVLLRGGRQPPTRTNIVKAFAKLVEDVTPGDSVFLAYSGPAKAVVDELYGAPNNIKANPVVMVPMDAKPGPDGADPIFHDDLMTLLLRHIPQGVTVTLLFDYRDSSHGFMDLPHTYTGRNSGLYNDDDETDLYDQQASLARSHGVFGNMWASLASELVPAPRVGRSATR